MLGFLFGLNARMGRLQFFLATIVLAIVMTAICFFIAMFVLRHAAPTMMRPEELLQTPATIFAIVFFAAASFPDAGYVEYYTRLAETAAAWQGLKARLASSFPGRPVLIVHYGDHQPVLTKQIERQLKRSGDDRRPFRTFYAIEALNIPHFSPGKSADLDIAFLGTVALQRAGIALDPVFATRASLLEDCREAYFASASERKRRFHRTLVDLGLIDLVPDAR